MLDVLSPRKEPRASYEPGVPKSLPHSRLFIGRQGCRGMGVPPDLPTMVERDQPFRSCAAATRSFHGARWELEPPFPPK